MRLLVTRPEPDGSRQAEKLRAMGHEPVLAPLLTIEILPGVALDLKGAQALIVTSRNVLRAVAARPELIEARNLPLYAIGDATADVAAELGFRQIVVGAGTGEQLADLIARELDPAKGVLVHLAGGMLAFDISPAGTLPSRSCGGLVAGGLGAVAGRPARRRDLHVAPNCGHFCRSRGG